MREHWSREEGRNPERGVVIGALCRDRAMSRVWALQVSRWMAGWLGGQMGRMMSGWVDG